MALSQKLQFIVGYAGKTVGLYLLAPFVARYLDPTAGGSFFLQLTALNLGGLFATLGFPTYLQRSLGGSVPHASWRHAALLAVPFTGGLAWVVFGLWSGLWSVPLLVGICARGFALFAEAKMLTSGDEAALGRIAIGQAVMSILPVGLIAFVPTAEVALSGVILGDLILAFVGFGRAGNQPDRSVVTLNAWAALTYSLPLLLAGLMNFGLNSLDRFVLTEVLGAQSLVDYSVMYSLAFAGHRLLGAPANVRLTASLLRRGEAADTRDIERGASLAVLGVALWGLGVVTLGPLLLRLLIGRELVEPLVSYALVASGGVLLSSYSLDSMRLKQNARTSRLLVPLTLAIVVNLGANVLLVPAYGTRGAALATGIAYLSMYLAHELSRSSRIVPRMVPFLACVALLALAAVVEGQ